MEQSLSAHQLALYTSRQMNHLFPDGNDVSAQVLETLMPMTLHRLETCFSGLLGRHFRRDGLLFFEHLNSDQYSMFLYFVANEAFHAGESYRDIALKGYLLNKGRCMAKEDNKNRVEGSLFAQHVFGTLSFSGEKDTRQMKLTLFDKEGKELWNKVILKKELE